MMRKALCLHRTPWGVSSVQSYIISLYDYVIRIVSVSLSLSPYNYEPKKAWQCTRGYRLHRTRGYRLHCLLPDMALRAYMYTLQNHCALQLK